jgi:A/G-specific adenine glycosylase
MWSNNFFPKEEDVRHVQSVFFQDWTTETACNMLDGNTDRQNRRRAFSFVHHTFPLQTPHTAEMVTQALLDWYAHKARPLPWRASPRALQDPYVVWISESMLQQTTVSTVIPYFARFLIVFPTLSQLAEADLDEILILWQGLGYYARARHLHCTARIIQKEHKGSFPKTAQLLQKLPGIGPYTAAAIASMAFREPVVALDANVSRVVARLFALPDRAFCLPHAQKLLSLECPGDFNQALMDIGAQYCQAHRVTCMCCPLKEFCQAKQSNAPLLYPAPRKKTEKRARYATFFCIWCKDTLLLEQRPEKGLLGGLYGLPTTLWTETPQDSVPTGPLGITQWHFSCTVTHIFTHFRLQARVLHAHVPEQGFCAGFLWVPCAHLEEYALPTVFKKALRGR